MEWKQNKHVLIAGGSKAALLSIGTLINQDDCEIHYSHTGDETVSIATGQTFDLMVLDLSLLDMPGTEIIQKIREYRRDMESVVSTAPLRIIVTHTPGLDRSVHSALLQLDVSAVFCKPLTRSTFSVAVNTIIQGADQTKAHKTKRVLAVDPEQRVRVLYKNMLSDIAEIEVIAVENCYSALETIELYNVDLLITEQNLPDMTGNEFVKTLREEVGANFAIFVVSSNSSKEVIEEAKKLGIQEYITKPFKLEEFKKLIRDTLSSGKPVTKPKKPEPSAAEVKP